MKKFVLLLIRFYQRFLSLDSGYIAIFKPHSIKICRFTPSCSAYTYEAVCRYNVVKGLWLGLKRFVRCNIFFPGGYDPVP